MLTTEERRSIHYRLTLDAIDWDESEHPRGKDGRFGQGAGKIAPMDNNNEMPRPRSGANISRYQSEISEQALFSAFMSAFGGNKRHDFVDVVGNHLLIDRNLFETLAGDWKIKKRGRAEWLMFTAENIKNPDEIRIEKSDHGGPDKLYYLSRFEVGKRGLLSCITVFEREQSRNAAWSGRTNFATLQDGYAEKKRSGKELAYRRRDQ